MTYEFLCLFTQFCNPWVSLLYCLFHFNSFQPCFFFQTAIMSFIILIMVFSVKSSLKCYVSFHFDTHSVPRQIHFHHVYYLRIVSLFENIFHTFIHLFNSTSHFFHTNSITIVIHNGMKLLNVTHIFKELFHFVVNLIQNRT